MTREEKLRMLLHPEQYTDEQMDQMLNEEHVSIPDANEAWQELTNPDNSTQSSSQFSIIHSQWRKIAAMFIGVLILSGIAYAAFHSTPKTDSKPKVAVTQRKPDVKKVKKTYGIDVAPTKKAPIIYNNVELQQIMKYIADGYGVKVEFKNDAARTLRFYLQWDSDDTLQDIIDRINHFEKVHLTLSNETITIE